MIDALTRWLESTTLSDVFMSHAAWAWPLAESLHFVGLSLLVGGVGLVDLRLLGLGRGIGYKALHPLVRWGVAGFALNVVTGTLFLSGTPDQYLLNRAFHFKLAFLLIAGINVVCFYAFAFPGLKHLGPTDRAGPAIRLMAGISLFCWIGVICAGRLLTFYRP